MPLDAEALSYALHTTLQPLMPEDLEELCTLLQEEALAAHLECLPQQDTATLEQIENEPLANVLQPYLKDYFQLDDASLLFLMGDILDAYRHPKPPDVDEPYVKVDECELCERKTRLTKHHLLPRTEHALLIKRALATREDCKPLSVACTALSHGRYNAVGLSLSALPLCRASRQDDSGTCPRIQHNRQIAGTARCPTFCRVELQDEEMKWGSAHCPTF
jgi:hypothetical protein